MAINDEKTIEDTTKVLEDIVQKGSKSIKEFQEKIAEQMGMIDAKEKIPKEIKVEKVNIPTINYHLYKVLK